MGYGRWATGHKLSAGAAGSSSWLTARGSRRTSGPGALEQVLAVARHALAHVEKRRLVARAAQGRDIRLGVALVAPPQVVGKRDVLDHAPLAHRRERQRRFAARLAAGIDRGDGDF